MGRLRRFLADLSDKPKSRHPRILIEPLEERPENAIGLEPIEVERSLVTQAMLRDAWPRAVKRAVEQGKRLVCFMTDRPEPAMASDLYESQLWPVVEIEAQASPAQAESQPAGSLWTHARAGELLMQYELDRMALRPAVRARLAPGAQCVWRLQNGDPFVAAQPLGQGVTLWVNTSVDASRSRLAKSSAAVAWAQFLLDSGQGFDPGESHDPWRDTEPVLQPPSPESIEKVTRTLFCEDRSSTVEPATRASVTQQRPMWRPVAWCLLILLLAEPFVAERMKP